MSEISLAMIVKNEEKVLGRCLESIKDLVDEIVIVDTGSCDKTKEIAFSFTDKVFDLEWQDDFSFARNYSFSKCSKEFIIWLDADDVFDDVYKSDFLLLKEKLSNYDVVMLTYNIAFNEVGEPTFSYLRERILRKNMNFMWQDAVHEVIVPRGRILKSDIAIKHLPNSKSKQSNRNLKIYEKLIKNGKILSARQKYYYARELMFNKKYSKAIKKFNELLEQENIWKENAISACKDLSNCFLEKQDIKKAKESLIKSFLFDSPRAEICCKLGEILMSEKNYYVAINWFKIALGGNKNLSSGAFIESEYYDLIPHLQLCVCYYYLGKLSEAKKHNDLAGSYNPQNEAYLSNKKFFEGIEKNNKKNRL